MPFHRKTTFRHKKRNFVAFRPDDNSNIQDHSTNKPIDIPGGGNPLYPRPINNFESVDRPPVPAWTRNELPTRIVVPSLSDLVEYVDIGVAMGSVPASLCPPGTDLFHPPRLADEISEDLTAPLPKIDVAAAKSKPAVNHLATLPKIDVATVESKPSQDSIAEFAKIDITAAKNKADAQDDLRRDSAQTSPVFLKSHSFHSFDRSDSGVSTVPSTKPVIGARGYRSDNGTFAGALLQRPTGTAWLSASSPSRDLPGSHHLSIDSKTFAGSFLQPPKSASWLSASPLSQELPDSHLSSVGDLSILSTNPGKASGLTPTPRSPYLSRTPQTPKTPPGGPLPAMQTSPPDPEEHGTVIVRGGFMDLSPPPKNYIDPMKFDEAVREFEIKAHEDFLVAMAEVKAEIGKMREKHEREEKEWRAQLGARLRADRRKAKTWEF